MSLKKRDDYNQISQMEKRDKKTWKKTTKKVKATAPLPRPFESKTVNKEIRDPLFRLVQTKEIIIREA